MVECDVAVQRLGPLEFPGFAASCEKVKAEDMDPGPVAKAGCLTVLLPGEFMNRACNVLVGLSVLLLFSCSPMYGTQSEELAECWSPSVDTYDADAGVGCSPNQGFNICTVSNGATVLPDGGVFNGTESCRDFCSSSEYSLICRGGMTDMCYQLGQPSPLLGCTVVPIPTPACTTVYCCPCS